MKKLLWPIALSLTLNAVPVLADHDNRSGRAAPQSFAERLAASILPGLQRPPIGSFGEAFVPRRQRGYAFAADDRDRDAREMSGLMVSLPVARPPGNLIRFRF